MKSRAPWTPSPVGFTLTLREARTSDRSRQNATPYRATAGFTLVELLVSVSVLILIIAAIASVMNSATLTTTGSRKHMDADASARLIFDRMAEDFGQMVKRPDVNYILYKANAGRTTGSNDAMFFYTEAPAYATGTSNLSSTSLVGYRIDTQNPYYPNTPVLERLGENLTWDQPNSPAAPTSANPGGMVFMTYPSGSFVPAAGSTLATNWTALIGPPPFTQQDPAYHILSDQILRMEICFLIKSGTFSQAGGTSVTKSGYSNTPSDITPTGLTTTGTLSQPYITGNYFSVKSSPDTAGNVYGLPPDLEGIVVTLAVLDDTSRKIASGTQLSSIATNLPDSLSNTTLTVPYIPTFSTTLPAQKWLANINSKSAPLATVAGVPQVLVSQLRIYQRLFVLNAN
jgi:type II secretory pathway pseudopilin PulG